MPVRASRMIDTETGETSSPERYFRMKELPETCGEMREAILLGLSQNDDEQVASEFINESGPSQSAVTDLHVKLQEITAACSLKEDLEETLTLHRPEVLEEASRSLKTTNAIENLSSLMSEHIGNVMP